MPLDCSPPEIVARRAGLAYVHDDDPGLSRRPATHGGFAYLGPGGRPVDDAETLARIRRLAIPPAYTEYVGQLLSELVGQSEKNHRTGSDPS